MAGLQAIICGMINWRFLVQRFVVENRVGAWAAQERQRWTRVVKQSGAKAE